MRYFFGLILLYVWLISCAILVRADQTQCFDTLAAPLFPGAVRSIPNEKCIRFFAETFTDGFPLAKKELESGRQYLGIDLLWSDTHSYGDSDIPSLRRLAKKYDPLCAKYPGKVELSPFTEHNLTNPDKYLDIAQASAPDCTIVNSVWNGSYSRKYKNEIHGNHSPPSVGRYNYSFDGTNALDADVTAAKKKYAKAERFYLWTPRDNCRWSMNDSRSRAERIRDCAKPTVEFYDSVEYLFTDKGDTHLPPKWISKSHAERHDLTDPKGDHLLFISPIKSSEIVLKRSAKVVAKLPYFGPYLDSRFRYYYSDYAYHLGSNLEVWINGKEIGKINAGFRDGAYRD